MPLPLTQVMRPEKLRGRTIDLAEVDAVYRLPDRSGWRTISQTRASGRTGVPSWGERAVTPFTSPQAGRRGQVDDGAPIAHFLARPFPDTFRTPVTTDGFLLPNRP